MKSIKSGAMSARSLMTSSPAGSSHPSSYWFQQGPMTKVLPSRSEGTRKEQRFGSIYVIDFEATCNGDQKNPLKPQEIIEFPCVRVETRGFKPLATFHEFVRPVRHPNLTYFCTDLTGIVQETVDGADEFPQVFGRFLSWLEDQQKVAGEESAFLTLGDWDFKTMLPSQCQLSGVELPPQFHQWINVKRSYQATRGDFPRSMVTMLNSLKIPLVGRHHSGIDDVNNIVTIVQKLADQGCDYQITGKLVNVPHQAESAGKDATERTVQN